MLSARCRSVALACLLGGCATPSGRGRGGGLLLFVVDGGVALDDEVEVLADVDEEVEASLLEIDNAEVLVLKNVEGWAMPAIAAKEGAIRLEVEAHRHAVHRWRAMLTE